MQKTFRNLSMTLATAALAVLPVSDAYAKKKKKAPPTPAYDKALHTKFLTVKHQYLQGEITKTAAWGEFSVLHDKGDRLTRDDRVALLETQAVMLQEGGYPILSAIYASQAVKLAPKPLAPELDPSWDLLRRVSQARPIQSILEIVADAVYVPGAKAPTFGTDWGYFAGNAAARRSDNKKALAWYAQVGLNDRYYMASKYQQAMIYVDQEQPKQAEQALKAVLAANDSAASRPTVLPDKMRAEMVDYAHLALGRLYYEGRRFDESIYNYRTVSRNGLSFYDALFEQGWAFFMGGYPMHALGAMYAVESPFYKDVFNPEAPMLRAMIHYWLCRYDDSRNALADFAETYQPQVEKLNQFLDRKRLDPEMAYTLFENMVSGVSDESLGVPRSVLKTAAEKDSMLLIRDQYASILEERAMLDAKGIFGDKTHSAKPFDYLDRWSGALRKDIGKRFLAELTDMKKDYDRLFDQGQFLYVELLMSQKDQLLGRELHADTKITHVSQKMDVTGWAPKTQAWRDSRNGEYWWDEVGYYITPVDSMCQLPGGAVAH